MGGWWGWVGGGMRRNISSSSAMEPCDEALRDQLDEVRGSAWRAWRAGRGGAARVCGGHRPEDGAGVGGEGVAAPRVGRMRSEEPFVRVDFLVVEPLQQHAEARAAVATNDVI